jgi:chromosome segregation ATPase
MTARDAYVRRLKAELDECTAELGTLEAEIQELDEDRRMRYEDMVQEVRRRCEEAGEIVVRLQGATEETRGELREGAETAWDSLKESFRKAKSEFKRGYTEGLEGG